MRNVPLNSSMLYLLPPTTPDRFCLSTRPVENPCFLAGDFRRNNENQGNICYLNAKSIRTIEYLIGDFCPYCFMRPFGWDVNFGVPHRNPDDNLPLERKTAAPKGENEFLYLLEWMPHLQIYRSLVWKVLSSTVSSVECLHEFAQCIWLFRHTVMLVSSSFN